MTKTPIVTPIFEDSASIWIYLKEQAGLDTTSYDVDLEHELRTNLSFQEKDSLDALLRLKGTPVETFLSAFFTTVQPYAEMMSDLLRMFEKAGATQANKNLAIRFDFGADVPDLSFDLTHFRQWNEIWSRVAGVFLVNVWDYESIWALNGALRNMQPQISNSIARNWLTEYNEFRRWPKVQLQPPRTGVGHLDEILRRAWRVWMTVVIKSAFYGESRDDLCKQPNRRTQPPGCEDRKEQSRESWPPEFLARIDSDGWAGSFAAGAYEHAERISKLSPEAQQIAADGLARALQQVLDHVAQEEFEGETLVQCLEEFLQLPIWKRRHELYSTWVGSQIVDACDEYGVKIHQVNGSLLIAFSGTHLATLTCARPTMHIWAELRSPLQNPVGKGRKRRIQPDFSVVGEPITSPEMSILEVECKQYKTASAKNFCEALTDYATGRPNARVILVNYGCAHEALLDGVPLEVRDRTSLIGQMRPGSSEAQAKFKELVSQTVSGRCIRVDAQSAEMMRLRTDVPATITLSWGGVPRDLDLYARIVAPRTDCQVDFSNPGSAIQAPWVKLESDVRHGHGPETISIERWISGASYHLAVHNYSDETPIADCGASVAVTQGALTRRFQCPATGTGRWWSVLLLHSSSGDVQVIDKIVDIPW